MGDEQDPMSQAAEDNWNRPIAVPPPPTLDVQSRPRLLVPITHGSVLIGNTAYPLHNISSVQLTRQKGENTLPLLFLILGLSMLLGCLSMIPMRASNTSLMESILFFTIPTLLGLGMIYLSRILQRRVRDLYIVQITTNAGAGAYFKTKDAKSAQYTAGEIIRQTKV